ncbi:MAG: exodeoxyribonuclease VII small subunit [bacterium]|nr:exodeoxyribonuclease VII small subunit [bacterium]
MEKKVKFEEAIKRLEEIVEELETGEFDLDKAIQIFEEGLNLTKFCKKKLDEAEQKIEIIKKQNLDDIMEDAATGIKDEKKENYKKEKTDIGLLLNNKEE